MIDTYKHGSGITLHRIYVHNADEVGTINMWSNKLWSLFAQHPFKEYWADHVIRACNLAADETPQDLIDYDRETPGFQVADGLDPWGPELWISFYPPNFNPENPQENTAIPAHVRQERMNAVDHEIGHQHDQWIGFRRGEYMDYSTPIQQDICKLIDDMLPNQGHNKSEDFAECYRCLMGSDSVRGTFSDGKRWNNSTLRGLMRGAWWVSKYLHHKEYNNLTVSHNYIQWSQPRWWWHEWFRFNSDTWQLQKYTNKGWINA